MTGASASMGRGGGARTGSARGGGARTGSARGGGARTGSARGGGARTGSARGGGARTGGAVAGRTTAPGNFGQARHSARRALTTLDRIPGRRRWLAALAWLLIAAVLFV